MALRTVRAASGCGGWRRGAAVVAWLCLAGASHAEPARSPSPVVSTYVGTGEPGLAENGTARFEAAITEPYGLAVAPDGTVYFADYENNLIRRVDARSAEVTSLADIPSPQGLALDGRGGLYAGSVQGQVWRVDLASGQVKVVAGGGRQQASSGPATELALLGPGGVHVRADGRVLVADGNLHVVFEVDPRSGRATVVAGRRGQPGASGDGGPATDALLNAPVAVVSDNAGNLYISEAGSHTVRRVDGRTGWIRTLAGVASEKGDSGDGAATGIRFNWPAGLLLRDERRLLIADVYNHRVRELDLGSGVIRTVAGSGRGDFGIENLPALDAAVPYPVFLAAGPAGELYVSSPLEYRVLRVGAPGVVPSPWWQSPWAWLAMLAALGGLLYGAAELRAHQLRRRAAILEQAVAGRTRELAARRATAAEQAQRLSGLVTSKDDMLAQIAQQLGTPLDGILGTVPSLRDAHAALAEVVERNASRLKRLVGQLRQLTRLEPPADAAGRGVVVAAPLCAEIVATLEPAAAERGLKLELERAEPVEIGTTREAFETIVVNLVSNAIKYTAEGGRIRVRLAAQQGQALLEVSDTGRGIAAQDQARVFEPFERVHGEGERIPGSGLGLALVKEQAESDGGRVELTSELGQGSTFRVSWPLGGCARVSDTTDGVPVSVAALEERGVLRVVPASVTLPPTDARDNAATVLVVEDHPDMRRYLCDVLTAEYRCLVSDDGVVAVALAREELPDVVVCDVMLPGQDGLAVCRALRNDVRTSHIPVVLLTALADGAHRVAGLAELADDYLAKPFSEAELRLRVRNLLDLRAMLQRRCAREIRFERSVPADLDERERVFLGKLGRVVARRYGEVGLDLSALAAEMALSERQLQRKLKALTGLTPGEYLRDYRLVRSHEQLCDGQRASEVARACGFVSAAHFATCFRARFGHVPSETRARSQRRA